jgi:biotin transport system substrate-specific component
MKTTTLRSVFVALFAALIAAGCFIAIPIGPAGVPIVLQNMIAILSACIMGGIQGAAAVGLFLAAGALGIPVYSGGHGGVAHLAGPTGGFLIGYFFGALAAGLIAGKPSPDENKVRISQIIRLTFAALAGFVIVYVPGVYQFMHLTGKSFLTTMTLCVLPFLPGDVIKITLTVIISLKIRPAAGRYLYADEKKTGHFMEW